MVLYKNLFLNLRQNLSMRLNGYSGIEILSFLSLLNLVFQLSRAPTTSFSVAVGSASLVTTSVTISLTVKMAVMSILAVR